MVWAAERVPSQRDTCNTAFGTAFTKIAPNGQQFLLAFRGYRHRRWLSAATACAGEG